MLDMLTTGRFWVSFLIACAFPCGMYLIAYMLESRKPGNGPNDIPVWRDQSKAFLPGDIGLAWLLAVGIYLSPKHEIHWWMLWVGMAVGLVVYVLARRFTYTPADYTREAWNSPSKVYHDMVMYILFVMVLVTYCVPVYFTSWSDGVAARASGLIGLLFWAGLVVKDLLGNEVPNDRQHPSKYSPIWQRN